jgi:hypothetical protein
LGLKLRPLAGRQDAVNLSAELLHVCSARLRIGVLVRLAHLSRVRHDLLLLRLAQTERVQGVHEVAVMMTALVRRSRRRGRGRLSDGGERK